MIHLSRLNGQGFVLNPDLILKAESTPDTVVTLVDGTKFVVAEPLDALASRVLAYRAQVVAAARELPGTTGGDDGQPAGRPAARPGARPAVQPAGHPGAVLAEPVPLRRRRTP